jgi:hypothetical protein
MAPQPVDDPMTGSVDEIMTVAGVDASSARRAVRRSKALPMDPAALRVPSPALRRRLREWTFRPLPILLRYIHLRGVSPPVRL